MASAVFSGYFALGTAISNTGVLTEVSGGSYSRQAVNFTGNAVSGLTQSLGAFGAAAAPSGGTIYYGAIFDQSTGGNLIAYWPWATPASATAAWGATVMNVALNTVLSTALNLASLGGQGTSGSLIDLGAQLGTMNGLPMVSGIRLNVLNGGNLSAHVGQGTLTSAIDCLGSMSIGGLLNESTADNLTAHAGGGQTNALLLTTEMSRITTVATVGDSVKLPPSVGGYTIILENAGANAMQVYGSGSDTINAVATATGVSQMPGSVVIYTCYSPGAWFANGLGTGYSGSLETQSTTTAITAHAGGGQGPATQLTTMVNNITVCATTGDSVILPASSPGLQITVINNGAASCNVFPPSGSSINALAANTALACAATTVTIFFCLTSTLWVSK